MLRDYGTSWVSLLILFGRSVEKLKRSVIVALPEFLLYLI